MRPTPPESRSFRTRDGLRLVADAWGSPDAPPVLLAHGGGQTRHAWGGTAQTLAERGWYAVSLDQRGHGDSDWDPEGDYAFEAFARDLHDVCEGFETRPAVVGASLGGIAALAAHATAEGGCFRAVVLVDITPSVDRSGADKILGFMSEHVEDGFATLEEAADVIAAYLPHRPRPRNLDGLAKNLRPGDDGRYRWHWDPRFVHSRHGPRAEGRAKDYALLAQTAQALNVPTLLVRGRMSELVSEAAAQEFLRQVPHARYVDVSGAGHMVAGDRNDAFSDAVLEFLTEVDRG